MLINETGWFKRRKMLKNDEKQQAFFVLCQVDIFAKYPRVLLVSDWKDDVLEKNQTWLGKLEMRKKKKKVPSFPKKHLHEVIWKKSLPLRRSGTLLGFWIKLWKHRVFTWDLSFPCANSTNHSGWIRVLCNNIASLCSPPGFWWSFDRYSEQTPYGLGMKKQLVWIQVEWPTWKSGEVFQATFVSQRYS